MKHFNIYLLEKLKINKNSNYNDPDKKLSESDKKYLNNQIKKITYYWPDESIDKLNSKTDSIIERFWLATLLDYCKVNSSKYNDIDHVLAYFTDKGNIALYYDKSYLGACANIKLYPITVEFLKKFNIYYEEN